MTPKKHALTFVTITVLIDVIGFGIVVPVIPQFLAELTGEGFATASRWGGYLLFAYAVLQFLCAPLLGNLSDRFGRRPVLLVSLFAFGVHYLIAGLAPSIAILFIGRVLTGVAGATYATANALVADVSPDEERAQNFGLIGMAFGLGFIFGPTLGGLLGEWHVRAPFFAAAALAFCNTAYGFFALRETLPEEHRRPFEWKRANPVGALVQIRRYPALIGLLVALTFYSVAHHVYPANWNFYTIEKFGWSAVNIGLSMGFVGVLMAVVQGGLIRVVIPKFGAPRVAFLGFLAAATAFVGISLAPNGTVVLAWCTVSALSGFVTPAVQGILSSHVPASEQGELQGVVASLQSVATIIGPLLMTQTFSYFVQDGTPYYFPGAAFLVAAALAILGFAVFAIHVHRLMALDAARAA